MNSLKPVGAFQIELVVWRCWFLRRGENRSTRRKTSRSKGENQQQTQPTYSIEAPAFEPGPHYREASAGDLLTASERG